MIQRRTLPIDGYRGRTVPNTLFKHAEWTGHLAILLPDLHYTSTAPLFHYTRKLLLAGGADVLAVDFDYTSNPRYAGLSEVERQRWFLDDVIATWETAALYHPAERLTLAGKSLGALAVAHLLLERKLPESTDIIWITPPLEASSMREELLRCTKRSLVMLGSASHEHAAKLAENSCLTVRVYHRADDDLEREDGSVKETLDLLGLEIEGIAEFLSAGVTGSRQQTGKGLMGKLEELMRKSQDAE